MGETTPQPYIGEARGLLHPDRAAEAFALARYWPSDDLAAFVHRYWIVRWDLRGREPFVQDTLDYPCVNLVFERGHTAVFGPETGRSSKRLEGQGQAFGVKFWPGGFYPFARAPLTRFADAAVGLREALGVDHAPLEAALDALDDDAAMVALVERFLRGFAPQPDAEAAHARNLVDCLTTDRTITRVDDLARRAGMSVRSLQRLFSQYVGVSPKWAIRRCRLHEAAAALAGDASEANLSVLALDLGYFDQAHFIRDFRAVVGMTPAEYARRLISPAAPELQRPPCSL